MALRTATATKIADGTALLFVAVVCVVHVATGMLEIGSFVYGKSDTALYAQGLWLVSQARMPVSLAYPGVVMNIFLGQHVMLPAFLYGLAFRVYPGLVTLVVLEGVSYSTAVLLLYVGFRSAWRATWPALLLVYVYWAAFIPAPNHFYFENLAVPFTALSIAWMLRRQWHKAAVGWLVLPLFKEYFALSSAMIGLVMWWKSRHIPGMGLAAAALAWFALALLIIMPLAQTPEALASLFVPPFAYLGSSFPEIIRNFLLQPQLWIPHWLTPPTLLYLAGLVVPFALTGIAAPEYLLAVLPIVGLNVLIDRGFAVQEVAGHYSIAWLPLCAAAGCVGLLRIRERAHALSPAFARALVLIALGAMVVLSVPGLGRHVYWLRQAYFASEPLAAHSADVRATLAFVPDNSPVAATDELMPYFALRADLIHPANASLQRPQFVVLDAAYAACIPGLLSGTRGTTPGSGSNCYGTTDWAGARAGQKLGARWLKDGYEIAFTRGSIEVLQDTRRR